MRVEVRAARREMGVVWGRGGASSVQCRGGELSWTLVDVGMHKRSARGTTNPCE